MLKLNKKGFVLEKKWKKSKRNSLKVIFFGLGQSAIYSMMDLNQYFVLFVMTVTVLFASYLAYNELKEELIINAEDSYEKQKQE